MLELFTPSTAETRAAKPKRRVAKVVGIAVLVLVCAGAAVLAWRWPFTQGRMRQSLSDAIGGDVQFGRFRQTFLMHPGCVAENVIISQPGGRLTVTRFTVEANYTGLFFRRISRVTFDSAEAILASLSAYRPGKGSDPEPHIDELVINGGVLQIGGDGDRFQFHKVVLGNISDGHSMPFDISVAIPRPAGEVTMKGTLGAISAGTFEQTTLAGSYAVRDARLGVFSGIDGTLASQGKFSGALSNLNFEGETDTPDFTVTSSTHRHHLKTAFHAIVNGVNGDTRITQVEGRFDGTVVQGVANITGSAGELAKTIRFDVQSGSGRIQDLMTLFIKAPQSPMLGPVTFKANIVLPPGREAFKKRVILDGDFGISGGNFTKPATQLSAEQLSERAEGEAHDAPERVLSKLAGHVALRHGIATFSNTTFEVPGAKARVEGTVSLITEKLDFQGRLAMAAELSQTETGFKSVFLKLLNPIYKKRKAGAVLPVTITGTYGHPEFKASLIKK